MRTRPMPLSDPSGQMCEPVTTSKQREPARKNHQHVATSKARKPPSPHKDDHSHDRNGRGARTRRGPGAAAAGTLHAPIKSIGTDASATMSKQCGLARESHRHVAAPGACMPSGPHKDDQSRRPCRSTRHRWEHAYARVPRRWRQRRAARALGHAWPSPSCPLNAAAHSAPAASERVGSGMKSALNSVHSALSRTV
jgi:hypothetical protein